jgi:hypothetical protein
VSIYTITSLALDLVPLVSILSGLPRPKKTLIWIVVGIIVISIASIFLYYREPLWLNLFVDCHDLGLLKSCYPSESMFYNYPLLGLILVSVLLVVFYFIVRYLETIKFLDKFRLPKMSDTISAFGVIVALLIFVLPYIALTPLLDYDIKLMNTAGNLTQLNIIITNQGLVTAKNLIVSIEVDKNIKFLQVSSEPIQGPIQVFNKNNETKSTYFGIETLPPRATTIVKADLSVIDKNIPTVVTYLRSSETTGFHGISYVAITELQDD